MKTVMLGAGGRLGQLLRPRWPDAATWTTRADTDIDDPKALARALDTADAVFCFAGATSGSNARMGINISVACKALDAANGAQVFLFSSAAVYGALSGPLTEEGPTSAQSPYARSKLEMEETAAAHPNPSTVLRLGNVAGADAILGNWKPGFELDELADGTTPTRSYIAPSKLAQVLHTLSRQTHLPPILNISAPGTVQMGDLLNAAGFAWTPKPATPQTIAKVHLDTTKLEQKVQFAPQDSTAQGIVADWRQEGAT